MTSEQHRKAVSVKQGQITKLRNSAKAPALSLAEKLAIRERVKALEEDLRQFKLNFYELVSG